VLSAASRVACEALRVTGGDHLRLGALDLTVIETPGHTPESLSFYLPGCVLTGDALMIGTCGRTDFQGGDPGALFDSVHTRLFTLPEETRVFPAHDYRGRRSSTIGVEKRENERLANRTRAEFIALMNGLHLPPPRNIDEALPANLRCGKPDPQA
jgi:glyoxylase-like metal-dependent hydrolase (beta-lactamase superfamily II)